MAYHNSRMEPRERQCVHEPTFKLDTSPTRVAILHAIPQDKSGIACIRVWCRRNTFTAVLHDEWRGYK